MLQGPSQQETGFYLSTVSKFHIHSPPMNQIILQTATKSTREVWMQFHLRNEKDLGQEEVQEQKIL